MRYSYEFKMLCIEMYRKGHYPDTPSGLTTERFHDEVREWVRLFDAKGSEALRHKASNKIWSNDERLSLISRVLAGESCTSVAFSAGINPGLLYQWIRRYKIEGYEGLTRMKKGRPLKEPDMKNDNSLKPLTESEREELIRLRSENEYIKAEIEVIKKEIALRHAKWDEKLRAKKQRSSRNSVKKDTN